MADESNVSVDSGGPAGLGGQPAAPPPEFNISNEDIASTLSWLGEDVSDEGGDPGEESSVEEGAEASEEPQAQGEPDQDGEPSGDEVDTSAEVTPKSILDPGEQESEGEEEAKPTDWKALRQNAISKALKSMEPSLSKRVTAADLPKELEKRRSAMERQLSRYATLDDALIAGLNAQEKIRTGQYKQPLPENASEAERAEWRQANNIPKDAKDYDARVPDHQWTEADQPIIENFKETAFAANFTQDQLSAAAKWFKDYQAYARETIQEQQTQIDRADTQAARELLREHLEGDFGPSITLMGRFLNDADVFPEGLGAQIAEARLPDGRRLINNPDIARFFIESARGHYGEGAMITGHAAEAMQSEEAELEQLLNSDIGEFQNGKWKNTGISGSERMLQIARQKESRGRRG